MPLTLAPMGGGGPQAAGGGGVQVYEIGADQDVSSTSYSNINNWTIPLPANEVVTFDGILVFQTSATTNGFGFGARPRAADDSDLVVNKFLTTFEYQNSAGSWITFTQSNPTTLMNATTSAFVANSGILCRITGQVDVGPTPGELRFQVRSELPSGTITVRKGSPLRVM